MVHSLRRSIVHMQRASCIKSSSRGVLIRQISSNLNGLLMPLHFPEDNFLMLTPYLALMINIKYGEQLQLLQFRSRSIRPYRNAHGNDLLNKIVLSHFTSSKTQSLEIRIKTISINVIIM